MKTSKFPEGSSYTGIFLFNESGHSLPISKDQARVIASLIEQHDHCSFRLVEIVFVDENDIVRVNRQHLEREYVTDIITFRYDEDPENQNQDVEGTLYCCAPRIMEQARVFNETKEREFGRILIHGLLHLIGYDDQSDKAEKIMHERENFYLDLLS